MRAPAALGLTGLLVVAGAGVASAQTSITGTVFVDRDGDGLPGVGEAPVAGARVYWETVVWTTTDAQGRFALQAPRDGIVWVRPPEGYAPEPGWQRVMPAPGEVTVDLPLVAHPIDRLVFVHVSDIHIGLATEDETRDAFDQVMRMRPAPAFVAITGDYTSNWSDDEFDTAKRAISGLEVPVVHVPGNHDWHDGGPGYRTTFGPPMYSFDAGGRRGVVLNFNDTWDAQLAFLRAELTDARPPGRAMVFTHVPLDEAQADALTEAGVGWVFSGHLHSNRVIAHDGVAGVAEPLVEVNTESLVFGGIDYTPAGFRIVTLDGDDVGLEHHTIVNEVVATIVEPRRDATRVAGPVRVIAAVEGRSLPTSVTVAEDGGEPRPLARAGGWVYQSEPLLLVPGRHSLALNVTWPDGSTSRDTIDFDAVPILTPPDIRGDWPQLGGGPDHAGVSARPLMPPFITAWATAVGGHLRGGAPVAADGRIFVPVADLGDGTVGGVVALDAATGTILWERRTGVSVHNAPAVAEGLVVFASADGRVRAHAVADGAPVWDVDLGAGQPQRASWVYSAPTIVDGVVVIGTEMRLVGLDLMTGVDRWDVATGSDALWQGSYAGAAGEGGVVISQVGRKPSRVVARRADDGTSLWEISSRLMTSPVVGGGVVFLADVATVRAVDLATGAERWEQVLYDTLGYSGLDIAGTPAFAGGRLLVPTPTGRFLALELADASLAWSVEAEESNIRPVPYATVARAFTAAPTVTGDLVWIPGADGRLRGVSVGDGTVQYEEDLRVPLLSGVTPVGDALIVASYDGTVRSLRTGVVAAEPPSDGCGCRAGAARSWHGVGGGVALALAAILAVSLIGGWKSRGRRGPQR